MLININEALETGEPIEVTLDGAEITGPALQGQVEGHGDVVPDTLDFSFASPVSAHLELSSTGRDVLISGTVKTGLTLQCSRCLQDYPFSVDSGFSLFAPLAKEAAEKKSKAAQRKAAKKAAKQSNDLPDEESRIERELSHIEDGELNLSALVLEEITLRLPTKPLCKESCKGLCLSCGIDLNRAKCKCAGLDSIDPRLAKLKEFKIKQ